MAHVRHLMEQHRLGARSAEGIAEELGLSARRIRQLYAEYLEAVAYGKSTTWECGGSGGNRRRKIPMAVETLWRKLLSTRPPSP